MAQKLNRNVTVTDPTGKPRTFVVGSEYGVDVPEWAARLITNDALWDTGSAPFDPAPIPGSTVGVTAEQLDEAIEGLVTSGQLADAVAGRVTTEQLATAVAAAIDPDELATALADRVTTGELATAVAGAIDPDELATAIGGLVTPEQLQAAVADAIDSAELTDALNALVAGPNDLVTQAELEAALAGAGGGVSTLAALTDVAGAATAEQGWLLQYETSEAQGGPIWVARSMTDANVVTSDALLTALNAFDMASLADVANEGYSDGQILVYNTDNAQWQAADLETGQGANRVEHYLVDAVINSGTTTRSGLPAANVAASNFSTTPLVDGDIVFLSQLTVNDGAWVVHAGAWDRPEWWADGQVKEAGTLITARPRGNTANNGGTTFRLDQAWTVGTTTPASRVAAVTGYTSISTSGGLTTGNGGLLVNIDPNAETGLALDSGAVTARVTNRPLLKRVLAATTANITLSGEQTIDGVAVTVGNRVLVKNQTTASQNGIYTVANPGAWVRATDFDGTGEGQAGTHVYVVTGTENGNTVWTLDTFTLTSKSIGSDSMTFTKRLLTLAEFRAKGDLLVGGDSGVATMVRKPVGADGHVLTADSTASGGVKWAAVSGGGGGGSIGAAPGFFIAKPAAAIALPAGGYANLAGLSLTFPAAVGDMIELAFLGSITGNGQGGIGFAINGVLGTDAAAAGLQGGASIGTTGNVIALSLTDAFAVTAPMLSGGNLVVTLRGVAWSGSLTIGGGVDSWNSKMTAKRYTVA